MKITILKTGLGAGYCWRELQKERKIVNVVSLVQGASEFRVTILIRQMSVFVIQGKERNEGIFAPGEYIKMCPAFLQRLPGRSLLRRRAFRAARGSRSFARAPVRRARFSTTSLARRRCSDLIHSRSLLRLPSPTVLPSL